MADWFNQIRDRYQRAQGKPQPDLATMLLGVVPQDAPPIDWAALLGLGGGNATAAQAPMKPTMEGSPVVPQQASRWQGEGDSVPGLLAPAVTVAASRPPVAAAPAPMSAADMAYVPKPANQTKDDYGPAWSGTTVAPPPQYSYLNPTPSLDEVFRREYAANPNGFTPGRFFGLFG